jgi:hypothetical protein
MPASNSSLIFLLRRAAHHVSNISLKKSEFSLMSFLKNATAASTGGYIAAGISFVHEK